MGAALKAMTDFLGFLYEIKMSFVRPAYILTLKAKTAWRNFSCRDGGKGTNPRVLFASPVGESGRKFLEKIIRRFAGEDVSFLIFVYDDTRFDEEVFKSCSFIRERGLKWQYAKKYLTPAFCSKYDYILIWADDIDVDEFCLKDFLDVMGRNNMELAQPALSGRSYYNHRITLKDERFKVGRYTDYVEVMAMAFTSQAWARFWQIIEEDTNFWGWGYDSLAKSLCGFKNIGIVDCETVTHTRPCRGKDKNGVAYKEMLEFFRRHAGRRRAKHLTYGSLR